MNMNQKQLESDYQWLAMQSLIDFKGQWIAILHQKIIARNSSLKIVKEKVQAQYTKVSPLYFRVPEGTITA